MSGNIVVELNGVNTVFGRNFVHRDLNLRVERGQIVGLLGESGSGKTTLLREMLGLWLPSAGSIHLFGFDLRDPDVMVPFAADLACCSSMGRCFRHCQCSITLPFRCVN